MQSARNFTRKLKSNSKTAEKPAMNTPTSAAETDSIEADVWDGIDRREASRRQRPTRPWSRLRGPFRRMRGRRSGDRGGYVDVYTRKDVALLLGVFLLNVGDAFFTMIWLSRGGREANPWMNFFLEISPSAFIAQKCFIVGLWLMILLVHKNFRFARLGLHLSLGVYALLLVLHFGIILFDILPPIENPPLINGR